MTKTEVKTASAAVKDILLSNPDGLHEVLRAVIQEVLEAEMDEALGASKSERTPERLGRCRQRHFAFEPGWIARSAPCGDAGGA
ncbi:transposase [Mesorhizobium sp. LSJC264A00]|uniref:transposase n=1 Tax=Mesorhizobium sp. LSJC264A00 TaxID=1287321 RepID=UPI000A01350D|nr:transposase [Mesorhizobium sp. LSJC264A00]